jgi:spermidine synthase
MSAFARAKDRFRYYEINTEVIRLAQGPFFTFISDSPGEVAIVAGDARRSLERDLRGAGSQRFDLLVMDAFSSDSVPVHLLTVEAFGLYEAHLRDSASILAVNVTNRYLDLEPVVAAAAQEHGFEGVRIDSLGDPPVIMESSWILLARDSRVFQHWAVRSSRARPLGSRTVRFTDRYSNLFRVLK